MTQENVQGNTSMKEMKLKRRKRIKEQEKDPQNRKQKG